MASHEFPIGVNQLGLAQLNERSREIFRLIVESYLATGEPVGSRNLSRILPMTLSPASVRNVMSDLEQLGLVYAPHTSAGRLPTEKGLRFFVDALMQIGDLTENDRRAIEAQVAASGHGKSVETVLTEASGLLSGLTRAAGVVLTAKSNVRLKHVEFVRLEPERALVVLVAEDGQVENRVLNVPVGLPTSALTEASNYLNAHIRGMTLAEAKGEIERALEARQAELDELTQKIVAAGLASWSGGESDERKLIVRGQAHLLEDLKALDDLERVRLLFDDLETRREVIDLLGICLLAKEGLGVSAIYEGGLADGDQDNLLIRADKNPNRRGLRWVAKGFGLELRSFDALLDGLEAAGEVTRLRLLGLLCEAELTVSELVAIDSRSAHSEIV